MPGEESGHWPDAPCKGAWHQRCQPLHELQRRHDQVRGPAAPRVARKVRDDGTGFDTNRPTPSAYGLLGMRFLVEAAQGTLRMQTRHGAGTEVTVTLPATSAG